MFTFFGLRHLCYEANKHPPIGRLHFFPVSGEMRREGESYKLFNFSVPLKTGPAAPAHPDPSPQQSSHDGNAGPRFFFFFFFFADNWKLQSTESNYPEQDFPNILRCLESSCLFRACALVLEVFLKALSLFGSHCCNAVQALSDMVSRVGVCVCTQKIEEECTVQAQSGACSLYYPPTGMPLSAV